MPITPDHSANFPQQFERCPDCGMKGVYRLRPLVHEGMEIMPTRWRCKYCGEEHRVTPAEVAALRQAAQLKGTE